MQGSADVPDTNQVSVVPIDPGQVVAHLTATWLTLEQSTAGEAAETDRTLDVLEAELIRIVDPSLALLQMAVLVSKAECADFPEDMIAAMREKMRCLVASLLVGAERTLAERYVGATDHPAVRSVHFSG